MIVPVPDKMVVTFDPEGVSVDLEQAYSDRVITMKMNDFFTGWI